MCLVQYDPEPTDVMQDGRQSCLGSAPVREQRALNITFHLSAGEEEEEEEEKEEVRT
jgi:hypothetical protein